jgi:dolichyl-diphosphooligosaccharide--protein glycosyltransferase/undecaprenyl-diphosphooligosaccharide--protein glycosyltransferase
MQKQFIDEKKLGLILVLMILAYFFSVGIRMYWPIHFSDNASMYYDNELMINTNDGYFFATGAKDIIDGNVPSDEQRASASVGKGLVTLTALLAKILPFSLETIILYLPAIIASLIVIPIVLTGRLIGHTILGFLAALLASIAWSYYNRTMVGYYDSDMFSVFLQFTIFYAFLYVAYKKDLKGIVFSAMLIFAYPYFYPQGMSLVYAMFILLLLYLLMEYKNIIQSKETDKFKDGAISLYGSVVLLSIPLMLTLPLSVRLILFMLTFLLILKVKMKEQYLMYMALAFFVAFLFFGNVFMLVLSKVFIYTDRGVEAKGLHFYQVVQTVREAGAIPMSTIAHRISGSSIGLLLSLIGYVLLVVRHKPFVIALPLIGVGLFAYVGGLRFTVYAVPIAALSVVYLFWIVGGYFKEKRVGNMLVIFATAMMIYPNITHIIGYKVPTVLNNTEVQDLERLKKISTSKDYTLSWWDYGYPIWYYSNTNTLIDGGKHQNDNFIISKIMQSTSPQLVANLARLAVETYVDSNYSVVADTLFKNKQKDQLDPNMLLAELESETYTPPAKTRDIYLYLPYRMLRIFPTVSVFGNLDLNTGKEERKMAFYPTSAIGNKNGLIALRNGILFDAKKGEITMGSEKKSVKYFVVTQNTKDNKTILQSQLYHADGEYAVVYMKSYGQFIVMDTETFNSTYVQMFILGKYDKNLFELVVSSPYSKIYKLKK